MDYWFDWGRVKITREELYEKVWAEPMIKVAECYGVSDVALAKLCKKLDVPRPPRGYWAKLEAGKPVRRARLPQAREGTPTIGSLPSSPNIGAPDDRTPITKRIAEQLDGSKIAVPEELVDPDPIVVQIQEAFASAYVDKGGFLVPRRSEATWIKVSPNTFGRTLRVIDALAKACSSLGLDVSLKSAIAVETPAGSVEFIVEELLASVEREPTPAEAREARARLRLMSGEARPQRYTRPAPSGRLSLGITSSSPAFDRCRWNETLARPIGKQLNAFLVGLVRFAENRMYKLYELERERRIEWERKQRLAQEERIVQQETSRRKELWQMIDQWSKSEQIRRFAAAFEHAHIPALDTFGLDRRDLLDWMNDYADEIDPLTKP